MDAESRRPSLFGPLLLIGLGILFLMANLDMISFDFVEIIVRFWPVILILAGLDMLFGRRANWVGGLIALLLIGFILAAAFFTPITRQSDSAASGETVVIEQTARGVERADIYIDASIGQLRIDATDAGSDNLIEGTVRALEGETVRTDYQEENNVARFVLESEGRIGPVLLPFLRSGERGQWDLQLGRSVPLRLTVSTGVGEAELMLEELVLDDLDVNTSVGSTQITLPDSGEFRADIDGGVGNLTIRIPESMAARIEINRGVGGISVQGDFIHQGEAYVSPGYDSARERADITVNGGVGSIDIEQVPLR